MASTTAQSVTLVAVTAQTVSFSDRYQYFAITNLTPDPVYFRSDGTAATVAGNGCQVVPPNESAIGANQNPSWYQSQKVILNWADNSNGLARNGKAANPGLNVSIIGAAAGSVTIEAAG